MVKTKISFMFILIIGLFGFLSFGCHQPKDEGQEENSKQSQLSRYFREDLYEIAPTLLHQAVLQRDLDAVKEAAQNGYSINTPNSKLGQTPLELALELKDLKISEYLAFFPTLNIYHQNLNQEGYLFLASKYGMFRVIQILFERHKRFNNIIREVEFKNFDFPNHLGQRALHVALNPETAEALRLSGYWSTGRMFDRDHKGQAPLHVAAQEKRHTFLQWAAQRYCGPYEEYFKHAVFPSWMNNFLAQGLKLSVEAVRWLSPQIRWDWYRLIASNPFNSLDESGHSPLHWAVKSHSLSTLQGALACEYSDLAQKNLEGQTALHLAAQSPNPEILDMILKGKLIHSWWTQRGEWLNQADSKGYTPLHYAALNLHQERSYQILLESGANVKILTQDGQSAEMLLLGSKTLRAQNLSKRDQ
jgi:ankyrin repeat protein